MPPAGGRVNSKLALLCRCSANRSFLTVQGNVRTMESVILTKKEQSRLQVHNGLLAEQMTTGQAATLMGVGTSHTGVF